MSNSSRKNHLTKKELKELREKILGEQERIQNKLHFDAPHKQIKDSNSGRDEVDAANDDIMRHTELRFATRESLYLKKIMKTLKLMEQDEYGNCEDCGEAIGFSRLMARPTSTMCIVCKEDSERNEMQSAHGRMSRSLGKSISLR